EAEINAPHRKAEEEVVIQDAQKEKTAKNSVEKHPVVGALERTRPEDAQLFMQLETLKKRCNHLEPEGRRLQALEKQLEAVTREHQRDREELALMRERVKVAEDEKLARDRELQMTVANLAREQAKTKKLEGVTDHYLLERKHFSEKVDRVEVDLAEAQQEKARHLKDREAFEEKVERVIQAGHLLRLAQLAYWNVCKHPGSMSVLLYSSSLALFQALTGAARKEIALESCGWTNALNVCRRVSQVPGLEKWSQELSTKVFPEIERYEIPYKKAVDPHRPDPERLVNSVILRTLLDGEVQLDGDQQSRISLDRLRGWPLFYRVDQQGIWGAQ
ncbi:MAG TPA: hypothetical protein VLE27_04620, partial [Thermoanaerobaculia bacterium]|nr:hypothetical protein [Thermoanaerobaculia bacterium]